jgi:hypothetical protein
MFGFRMAIIIANPKPNIMYFLKKFVLEKNVIYNSCSKLSLDRLSLNRFRTIFNGHSFGVRIRVGPKNPGSGSYFSEVRGNPTYYNILLVIHILPKSRPKNAFGALKKAKMTI